MRNDEEYECTLPKGSLTQKLDEGGLLIQDYDIHVEVSKSDPKHAVDRGYNSLSVGTEVMCKIGNSVDIFHITSIKDGKVYNKDRGYKSRKYCFKMEEVGKRGWGNTDSDFFENNVYNNNDEIGGRNNNDYKKANSYGQPYSYGQPGGGRRKTRRKNNKRTTRRR